MVDITKTRTLLLAIFVVVFVIVVASSLLLINMILKSDTASKTNVSVNATNNYYINVAPNPIIYRQPSHVNYKTIGEYSYYRISVCPFNDISNCLDIYNDAQGVLLNKESSIPLKNYDVGTYSVFLSGSNWSQIGWNTLASYNFTIISDKSSVSWDGSRYYFNDTMSLTIYVASETQNVVVYYPNKSILYWNIYSAIEVPLEFRSREHINYSPAIYSKIFLADTSYPPGIYTATITEGNTASTTLSPISNNAYNLTVPPSVQWGQSFTVGYQSPKSSQLLITDSDGNPIYGYPLTTVIDVGQKVYNTTALAQQSQIITISLMTNDGVRRTTKTIQVIY